MELIPPSLSDSNSSDDSKDTTTVFDYINMLGRQNVVLLYLFLYNF